MSLLWWSEESIKLMTSYSGIFLIQKLNENPVHVLEQGALFVRKIVLIDYSKGDHPKKSTFTVLRFTFNRDSEITVQVSNTSTVILFYPGTAGFTIKWKSLPPILIMIFKNFDIHIMGIWSQNTQHYVQKHDILRVFFDYFLFKLT